MSDRLLIATIGGSSEPVIASLLHWKPTRVFWVVSPESKAAVTAQIVPGVQQAGWSDFDSGRYDIMEVSDSQDFTEIVARLRQLDENVRNWLRDHSGCDLVADFTGGTKAMTAGLALVASRWPCHISYVGGTLRTKDGMGVVVSGKEQIVHAQNPWDAMGFLAVEEAITLFGNGDFSAATRLLEAARNQMSDVSRKQELQAFVTLCQFCENWERFQHKQAMNQLPAIRSKKNDITILFGVHSATATMRWLSKAEEKLKLLTGSPTDISTKLALVADLLANACRRFREGRYDDAVARLYRAIEAYAQAKLTEHGIMDTGKVPLNNVPETIRGDWQSRAEEGLLKLGLQDDYKLLGAMGSNVAVRFAELKLDDPQRSLLVARNSSILAHGYTPVAKDVTERLLEAALELTTFAKSDLLEFPKLK